MRRNRQPAPFEKIGTFSRLPADEMRRLGRLVMAGHAARRDLLDPGLDHPAEGRHALVGAIARGHDARQRLILANVAHAIKFGAVFAKLHKADGEEFVSEAFLGLIEATGSYDPDSHNAVFSTHNHYQMWGACRNALRDVNGEDSRGNRRVIPAYGAGLVKAGYSYEVFFSGPSTPEGETSDRVDREDERRHLAEKVRRWVAGLPVERWREVITLRYLGESTMTLEAIGERLGISKERVRQIEANAFRWMREEAGRRPRVAM